MLPPDVRDYLDKHYSFNDNCEVINIKTLEPAKWLKYRLSQEFNLTIEKANDLYHEWYSEQIKTCRFHKIITNYLDNNYSIREGRVVIDDSDVERSGPNLIMELETVFAMNKRELYPHAKHWAYKKDKKFRFNEYWQTRVLEFTMPIIRSIRPQMVAMELVSVQPMEVPKGRLFYMDYNIQRTDRVSTHLMTSRGVDLEE
jgi:hypothetical protein